MNNAWWYFWTVCFLVAGTGFFVIAGISLVRGVGDLRKMIRLLTARSRTSRSQ